mgnify:FL=1
MLCQLYPVYRTVQRRPAEQDDKSRAGTDQQGVGENTQSLDQSLFDRMCDGCRGRYVRSRSHTCLVAEQAALDPLHQSGTDRTACRLFPSESAAYDQFDDIMDSDEDFDDEFFDDDDEVLDPADVMNKSEEKAEDAAEAKTAEEKEPEAETQE